MAPNVITNNTSSRDRTNQKQGSKNVTSKRTTEKKSVQSRLDVGGPFLAESDGRGSSSLWNDYSALGLSVNAT